MLAQDSTNAATNAAATALAGGFILVYLIIVLGLIVLGLAVNWKIVAKAGYPGAYSLLALIPFANIVFMLIFAFTEWPIERQIAALRGSQAPAGTPTWQPPMTT